MNQEMSESDIGFPCPFCSTKLTISDLNIHQWIRCPKCNRPFLPDDSSLKLRNTTYLEPSSGLGDLVTSPPNMLNPQEANPDSDHKTSVEVLVPPQPDEQSGGTRVLKSKIIKPSQVNPMTSLKRLVIILLRACLIFKAVRSLLFSLLFQIIYGIGWYYPEELVFYATVMLISMYPRWFVLSHDS